VDSFTAFALGLGAGMVFQLLVSIYVINRVFHKHNVTTKLLKR